MNIKCQSCDRYIIIDEKNAGTVCPEAIWCAKCLKDKRARDNELAGSSVVALSKYVPTETLLTEEEMLSTRDVSAAHSLKLLGSPAPRRPGAGVG